MKTLSVLLILSLLIPAAPVFAERMAEDTQQAVVDRLERVIRQTDSKSELWIPTHQRLADLLSERARQRFMMEVEAGCKGCKGSTADRKRATKLYEVILASGQAESTGAVTLQLAHLKAMAGENAAAKKLYSSLTEAPKGQVRAEWVTDARVALADIEFSESHNAEAMKHYEILTKDKNVNPKDRAVIAYRLAWCRFNDGKLSIAISGLEKLIVSDMLTNDPAMRTEALMDLATFYSRREITPADVKKFRKLTPVAERKDLTLHFANEADRVGQKAAADGLLRLVLLDGNLTPQERLDLFLRRAQIQYAMGKTADSNGEFAVAALNLKELGCQDEKSCAEVQKRMKTYVTDMHRAQRVQAGADVMQAYAIYSRTFPSDTKMSILGAQVAFDNEKYVNAQTMYMQAADAATDAPLREIALDGEIKSAELAKNANNREIAYKHALKWHDGDAKGFAIRYQLAHLSYERKQWSQAAMEFRALALDRKGDAKLRKTAADLAMDTLALQKRDADIETWGNEFAAALPDGADEYRGLSRKALINQAAARIDSKSSSASDLRASLDKLKSADLKNVPENERLLILKNRAALAEKMKDGEEHEAALNAMLATKLSANERESALSQLTGAAETRKDYKTAYQTALKMKFPTLAIAEREHRLGTLAVLAGLDSRKHDRAALAHGLRGQAAMDLRVRLVENAANPKAELNAQAKELKTSREAYGAAVLVVYGRTRSAKAVEKHLAYVPVAVATFIRKQPFLDKQAATARTLAAHKLTEAPTRALKRSIEKRQALLKQADRDLTEALKLKDYASQVLALNTVALENDRFVQDVMSLPAPKDLTAEETKRYQALLAQTASPFKAKAALATGKLAQMWNQTQTIDRIIADLESSRADIRPLVRAELQKLADVAPSRSLRSKLESAANREILDRRTAQANVREL